MSIVANGRQRNRLIRRSSAWNAWLKARSISSGVPVNIVPYFFNVGVMSYGLNPQRPRDSFGLGFADASNSRGPVSIPPVSSTRHIPLPVPPNEQPLELTYGFALRPGVLLQPSLQYVIHPKGVASIPNALPPAATVPNALALAVNTVISL